MGHHGTLVRVKARWESRSPTVGSMLHLLLPEAGAHPIPCVVESASGEEAGLRAFVAGHVVFRTGSAVDLVFDGHRVGTGEVT